MEQETKQETKKEFDEENFKKMMDEIMKLPPLTGNMLEDYRNTLLKEVGAISQIWNEYRAVGKSNPLIDHHIGEITTMYDSLLAYIEPSSEMISKPDGTETTH
jgi:hypothetical protein